VQGYISLSSLLGEGEKISKKILNTIHVFQYDEKYLHNLVANFVKNTNKKLERLKKMHGK